MKWYTKPENTFFDTLQIFVKKGYNVTEYI